jgi:hypothetical protein
MEEEVMAELAADPMSDPEFGPPPPPSGDPMNDPEFGAAPDPLSDPEFAVPAPADDFELAPLVPEAAADEGDVDDAMLGALFKATLQTIPERQAAVHELHRRTGVPPEAIDARFDDFKRTWEAASFDPVKWGKDNPELRKLVLQEPALAGVAMRDEKVSLLTKTLRELAATYEFFTTLAETPAQPPTAEGAQALQQRIGAATEQAEKATATRKVQTIVAPEASATGFTRPFVIAGAEYRRQSEGLERSAIGFEILTRETLGLDTRDLEKRAAGLEQSLIAREYGQGPTEQVLIDMMSVFPSQVESFKAMGVGAIVGGAVGGVAGGAAGAVATRSPAGTLAGAKAGAGTGVRWGAKASVALSSFEKEAGGAYLDFRTMKTDDGQPVSPDVARGAALAYGVVASAIETQAFGIQLKAFGPLGEAVAAGNGKAFLAQALAKPSFRSTLANVGKAWAKSSGAEGLEEFAQSIAQDVSGYFARTATAGKLQKGAPVESIIAAAEAGRVGAIGGGLGIGAVATVVNGTTQLMQQARARRAGAQIAALADVADSPTVKAAPEAVAKMVADATAATGEPVTHVYVDPHAFTRLFQGENADFREAATQLLGPDGPRRLMEARVLGERLEIPVSEYLEKWGPTQAAQRLVEDTTTSPVLLTPRELREQDAQVEARAEELAKQYESEATPPVGAEGAWANAIEQQLIATKKMTPEQARKQARVHRAFIRTQAERFGLNADELFENFAVTVLPPEDTSFDFGPDEGGGAAGPATPAAPAAPAGEAGPGGMAAAPLVEQARGLIERMRDPEKQAMARAWFDYTQGKTQERPDVTPELERELARYGVVDPEGYAYDESGRSLERATPGARSGGQAALPEEFRRSRINSNIDSYLGQAERRILEQPAFHGTPHHFERFTLEKMGTGEGAQVFGWGLYFASRKAIAEWYRTKLASRPKLLVDGKPVDIEGDSHQSAAAQQLAFALADGTSPSDALAQTQKYVEGNVEYYRKLLADQEAIAKANPGYDGPDGARRVIRTHENILRWVQSLRPESIALQQNKGQTYQVEVPENDVLLDYDKPVAEQQPKVRAALERAAREQPAILPIEPKFFGEHTGSEVYWNLSAALGSPRAASEYLRSLGIPGARYLDASSRSVEEGGSHNFVIWDDTRVEVTGKLYQPKKADERKNLLVQHNISARSLLHADELGGLAAPSLAVARVEHPLQNFGEITLLGGPEMTDPKSGIPVFNADIYSPRHPKARFKIDGKKVRALREELRPYAKRVDGYLSDLEGQLEKDGPDDVRGSSSVASALRLAWLEKERGVKMDEGPADASDRAAVYAFRDSIDAEVEKQGEQAFREWADAKLAATVTDRYLPKYSDSGNMRRIPYTLENVLREMTRKIRQGESFNYGLGTARAAGAKKFRSLEQIQKARDTITSEAEFDKLKQEMDERFGELVQELAPHHPGNGGMRTMDALAMAIGESYKRGRSLRRELEADQFKEVPAELVTKVGDFAADLLAMPTEYFEAKPQRIVRLQEFTAAVVPEGAEPKVLEVLNKHGLEVRTYPKGDNEARQRAVAEATQSLDLLFQDKDSTARGYTEFAREGMKRIMRIALNESADLSTFLHESGHVFWEVFGDLAERPDAPESVRKDMAAALKWMGVENRRDLKVEHFEKWARGFEAYLMEGKAPSPELAGVFERFKLWLLSIYKSIKSLDVELNEDIRGVFDRLLATDEEIAAAKRAMGLERLFRSPEEAGMTPAQWQAYLAEAEAATSGATRRAELRVLKDRLKATEAWWKEEEAKERKLAALAYEELPARRAQRHLDKLVLDRAAVREMVGDAGDRFKADLVGVHPDELADLLGYPTGKALLEAVLALPDKATWTQARAAELMAEKHPSVLADKTQMRELAITGLHSEQTAHWLLREWAALRRKAGQPPTAPVEAIERAARLIVERRSVGKLQPGVALRSERTAANNAAKAAAKGDYAQAAVFKQQQLLNMYLHRELTKAREEREAFEKLAGQLSDNKARARLGKAAPIYRDGVDMLLETFGLKEPEENRETPLPSLGDVIAEMEAGAATVMFDEEAVGKLLAKPRDWKELSVADIRELSSALKNIRAAARAASTAIVAGKREDKALVIDALLAEATKNLPSTGPIASSVSAETPMQKLGGWWSLFDGTLLRPETMVRAFLGGGSIDSTWFKAIVQPLQEAKAREVDLLRKTIAPLLKVWEKMPDRGHELVDGKALFPTHRTDLPPPTRRFELLMLALNAGNESNLSRLLEGRNITMEQLQRALDILSKEEVEWVQSVWDTLESLWPEAAALEERDSGLRPPKLKATPLTLKNGTLRGGYFPAVYDRRVEAAGEKQVANAVAQLMDPSFTRPGTSRSHLKSRAQGFTGALSVEPSAIPSHLAQVAHDIAFREAIKSVGGLILAPDIQAVLKDRLGDGRAKTFLQWIKDVGQMRGAGGFEHAAVIVKFARKLKANTSIAALGYAVPNMIEDLSNIPASLARTDLKAKHLGAALAQFMGAPFESIEFARGKSGELRTQSDDMQRELANQAKSMTKGRLAKSFPGRMLGFVRDHAFILMEVSNAATSTPVWMGAYRQGLAEGRSDADAVTFADSIVRQVFPSHSPVDTSAVLRDKGFIGTSLMFYGFLNTAYNGVREIIHPLYTARGAAQTVARLPQVGARLLGYMIAVAVLSEFLRGKGKEDDEEWQEWFFRRLLTGGFAVLPGGGDVGSRLEAWWKDKPVNSNPRNTTAVGIGLALGEAVAKVVEDGGDVDKNVEQLLRGLGPAVGFPVAQPMRTGKYLKSVAEGGTDVRNPADFLSGVIYGERENQPATPLRLVGDAISGPR